MLVYEVTRDVPAGEYHNAADRDVRKGEVLYQATMPTWGCIDEDGGTAVSVEPRKHPFFEFPTDALEAIANV